MSSNVSDSFESDFSETLFSIGDAYRPVHNVLLSIVCVVGVTCNILNVIVLTRPLMRSPTNYILLALAVSDSMTMLAVLVYNASLVQNWFKFVDSILDSYWMQVATIVYANFTLATYTISINTGVLLAIFRYIYTCQSHLIHTLCTTYKTAAAVAMIYVTVPIAMMPSYFMYHIQIAYNYTNEDNETTGNETKWTTGYTFNMEPRARFITVMIHAIVGKLIPCCLMMFFVQRIILVIREKIRKRNNLLGMVPIITATREADTGGLHIAMRMRRPSSSSVHSRSSRMLVLVVVLFIVTELPHAIVLLVCLSDARLIDIYGNIGMFFDLLSITNSGINFALYCSMSMQFRNTFIGLFCRCCVREEQTHVSRMSVRRRLSSSPQPPPRNGTDRRRRRRHIVSNKGEPTAATTSLATRPPMRKTPSPRTPPPYTPSPRTPSTHTPPPYTPSPRTPKPDDNHLDTQKVRFVGDDGKNSVQNGRKHSVLLHTYNEDQTVTEPLLKHNKRRCLSRNTSSTQINRSLSTPSSEKRKWCTRAVDKSSSNDALSSLNQPCRRHTLIISNDTALI